MSENQIAEDINMVEKWLRFDPIRWLAGGMTGLLSGALLMGVGTLACAYFGHEVWFFLKLGALPIAGSEATELGVHGNSIFTGFLFYEGLALVLGVLFSHFAWTNSLGALAAMGLVWGLFSWIFICNLFIQSFPQVLAAHISPGATFPLMVMFGLSLTSLRFFDRLLRG